MKVIIKFSANSKGFLMLRIENPELAEIQSKIDPSDLAKKGLETDSHITILSNTKDYHIPKDLLDICDLVDLPKIKLDSLSVFEKDDCDVLKFEVNNSLLDWIHDKLVSYSKVDENYSIYNAHSTVAYLKKGKGSKYLAMLSNYRNIEVTPVEWHYSLVKEI